MLWVSGEFAKTRMLFGSDILRSKSLPLKTQKASLVAIREIFILTVPIWPSSCSKALLSYAERKGARRATSSWFEKRVLNICSYGMEIKAKTWGRVEYLPFSCLAKW